jgi:hypothetical protein
MERGCHLAARFPRSRTPVPGSLYLRRYNQPRGSRPSLAAVLFGCNYCHVSPTGEPRTMRFTHLIGDVVLLVRMPMSWELGTEDRAHSVIIRGLDDEFAIPAGAISSASLRASNPERKDDLGRVGPLLSTILTVFLRAGAWIGTNLWTWRHRCRRAC